MTEENEEVPRFHRPPRGVNDTTPPPTPLVAFEPHEEVAAAEFVSYRGKDFRYNNNRGQWMSWKGGVWTADEKNTADHEMRQMVTRRRLMGDLTAQNYAKLAKHSFASNALRSAQVHPMFSVVESDFDANPYLVACPSGYVDLRTGEIKGHDRDLMLSKCCGVDPAEKAENGQWDDFLAQTTEGVVGLAEYLQKFMGYALSGLMNEEIMSFMYGPGGNGKGVLLKSIANVFGTYAISAPSEVFMAKEYKGHSTEVARLAGARLIMASELDEKSRWDMKFIKEWTGNEVKITARFMRQDDFSFDPIGKLLFVGNHKPTIGTVDDATARRLRMLPFMNKPKIVDGQLKDKMRASYPAILRWVLDGAVKYFEEKHLRPPASVEGVTMSYLQDQDLVSDFIDQHTIKARDVEYILNRDLKTALQIYGELNGVRAPSVTAINKRFNDIGIPTSNIKSPKGERCVRRVQLSQDMLRKISERRNREGMTADGRPMSGKSGHNE